MRPKALAIILAIPVAAFLALTQFSSAKQDAAQVQRQQWEYDIVQTVTDNPGYVVKELNDKGKYGWEVCGTLSEDGNKVPVVLLKRAK